MKVAIIGNGGSVHRKENGPWIDSCDIVVRMKQYVTDGFEKYTGTKIDIYSSKWFSWFDNFAPYKPKNMSHVSSAKEFWFMFPDPNVSIYPKDTYSERYIQYSLKNDTPEKTGTIREHQNNIELFGLNKNKIRYMDIGLLSNLAKNLQLSENIHYDKKGKPILIEPSVGIRTCLLYTSPSPRDRG